MEPELLAPQYRDDYVRRCIELVQRKLSCEGCRKRRKTLMGALRKFQRGNFNMFPVGMFALLDSDCDFTASAVTNLSEFNIEPTDSFTGARLHSDGDWYANEATSATFGSSDGTWQGSCAIGEYDTRWIRNAGTVPNSLVSGTDGVWSAATTSKAVGYLITNIGVFTGNFNLECRDGASQNLLFSDVFTMTCNVDARN
jgi:hypothetical protein